MWLLDTNVLSELRRHDRTHPKVADPRAERDALFAATALVYRLKVATRNVAAFQPMGVDAFNPWEGAGGSAPIYASFTVSGYAPERLANS